MNKKIKILDVKITPFTFPKVITRIERLIKKTSSSYICVAAVHLVMEAQKNSQLLEGINSAFAVVTDGMPLVWLSKLSGSKNCERIYGPDLTLNLCQLANSKNYKVFILGGGKGQSKEVLHYLRRNFKSIRVVGNIDTPVRPIPNQENEKILKKINSTNPDFIFVGLGCPLQEQWMIDNASKIRRGVLLGVGAAFNFITGKVPQAPAWVRGAGFEWLFRLVQEPKRLWHRYTVLNVRFIFLIINQGIILWVKRILK